MSTFLIPHRKKHINLIHHVFRALQSTLDLLNALHQIVDRNLDIHQFLHDLHAKSVDCVAQCPVPQWNSASTQSITAFMSPFFAGGVGFGPTGK